MSPFKLSPKLHDAEVERLFTATRAVLEEWVDRLREETGDAFPEKVTAFRKEMAVHGRYKKPCPDCGASRVARQLSVFAAHGGVADAGPVFSGGGGGGGCCGGGCGCG